MTCYSCYSPNCDCPCETCQEAGRLKDVIKEAFNPKRISREQTGAIDKVTSVRRDFEDEARKRGWNLDRVLWGVEGWEESAYKDPFTLARWESWELAAVVYGGLSNG